MPRRPLRAQLLAEHERLVRQTLTLCDARSLGVFSFAQHAALRSRLKAHRAALASFRERLLLKKAR